MALPSSWMRPPCGGRSHSSSLPHAVSLCWRIAPPCPRRRAFLASASSLCAPVYTQNSYVLLFPLKFFPIPFFPGRLAGVPHVGTRAHDCVFFSSFDCCRGVSLMGTIWGRGFGCILAKPTVRTHVHALATHMSGRGVFHGVRGSHSLFLAQHSKVCDFIFLFFFALSLLPFPHPLLLGNCG